MEDVAEACELLHPFQASHTSGDEKPRECSVGDQVSQAEAVGNV